MRRRTPIVAAKEERLKEEPLSEGVRRTEITVEREIVSMRLGPGSSYQCFCPQCGVEVLMITAEAASATIGATRRQIYRWIEENRFHIEETRTGETFLCVASLASHQGNGLGGRMLLQPGKAEAE